MNKKVGIFDIETDGLLDTASKVWCCVIKNISTNNVFVWANDNPDRLISELSSYDVLIGHNCIAFDFPVLRKLYGWEFKGSKVDTLIMSRIQRPKRQAHSVEYWGEKLGYKKVQNEIWDRFNPIILERCRTDVEIQHHIYKALLEEGKGEGWANAHKLNFKLFHYLQKQEEHGWYLDKDKLDKHIASLNRWIDKIDKAVAPYIPLVVECNEVKKGEEYGWVRKPFRKDGTPSDGSIRRLGDDVKYLGAPFSSISIRPVDLNSNKEVKEFLIAQGWEPEEWNEDDDGNKTSAKLSKDSEFKGIQGSLGRLIAKRVQCRHRLSTLCGWKSEQIRSDGRISPTVYGMASTGRLRHKGIVNVPNPKSKAFFAKQMREVFCAQPGWWQVGVDSKGNQMRQLAARMGDKDFTQAVLYGKEEDGTDLHALNQKRSGAPSRSQGKSFFYALIFGAQAPKIAKTIKSTVEKAKTLIENYIREMPLYKELVDKLTNEWRSTAKKYYDSKRNRWIYKDGYIKGLDGRRLYVEHEHTVLCYFLQSDEAIQMALAYVKFHREMEKAGYVYEKDWGMNIWMHDEFQFECRTYEIAEHSAKIACQCITWAGKYFNIQCPHEGSYKIGRNWKETH